MDRQVDTRLYTILWSLYSATVGRSLVITILFLAGAPLLLD
jgi:hypothetical protein